jgi:fibronectin type 3 domain-containing protein
MSVKPDVIFRKALYKIILSGLMIFFLFAGNLLTAHAEEVGTDTPAVVLTCTWTGAVSTDWHTAGNWSACGGGIPGSSDNVSIPGSGVTNEPTISSADVTIHNLTIAAGRTLSLSSGRNLTSNGGSINNSGTMSGGGAFRTQGTVSLTSSGTFDPPLNVVSGTTTATGTLNGAITVDSGATLSVGSSDLIANDDVTVNGTLTTASSDVVTFNGATFTNNNLVSVWNTRFGRAGAQSIVGAGQWTGTSLFILVSSTTSLANDITFDVSSLTVNTGGELTLGSNSMILNGVFLSIYSGGSVTGTGTVRIEGTSSISSSGAFDPPLNIVSGTATATGTLNGAVTVDSGATLSVGSSDLIANDDVTVNGTLTTASSDVVTFNGATFTNNNLVSVWNTRFGRAGAQSIVGAGQWTGTSLFILVSSTTSLANDVTFGVSNLNINIGGTLDITGRTLSLSASGTPISNSGTLVTTGSTIRYNGSLAQTVATSNISYNNLAIDNAAGVSLTSAESIPGTLFLTNGTFTVGSNLTMGNAASIARLAGSLSAAPTFGTSVNVEYTGSTGVTSGYELPTSGTVLNNLSMDNSGGVTLNQNQTVNGTFTLTSGTFAIGTNTLTLKGAVSAAGGSLTSGATGTVNYNQGSAGQNVLAGNYGNLTFSNYNKNLASSGTIAIAGAFTPGSAGGHTISGSTIEYNGASAQTLPAGYATYNNLTLNNAAGVTGFAGLTVNGLLRVQQGTFTSSSTYQDVQIDSGATLASSAGSTINVKGNWTNNGVFIRGDGSVRFNGASPQTIGGVSGTTFTHLTIANASGVTLTSNAAVIGVLSLTTGDLMTGSNLLTMVDSASSTGSGDVVGNVRRTGPFTTGIAYSFGNPFVSLLFASGGTLPDNVTLVLAKNFPPDFTRALEREYTLTPSGGSGYSAALRLHYLDDELNGNPEAGLQLWRYDGSNWGMQSKTASETSDNWLERSGVTEFSRWALAASCHTLTASVSPETGGTVSTEPTPACNGKYLYGTEVTLTANTNPEYAFTNWSGDAGGANNPTALTMNGDKSVTANFALLSAPTNVQASDGTFTDKVQVSWTASSYATYYNVYRASTPSGTKSLLGSPAVFPYNDTSATSGVTYYYWVKACNTVGCSDYSASDSGWRNLLSPTGVSASDGTYTDKVQINWTASSGATSYKVYRAASATGAKGLLGSPTSTSYDDTTATPGLTYYYWVRACRGAHCSDYSASDAGWRNLSAPTGVTASDGAFTDKVVVSWTGSAGATSYQVYRATSATGAKAGPAKPTATTINDTSATPGVTYWYFVKACRGPRCSDFSAYDTGWRNIAPPTNLQASDGTFPDKVQVTWTASLGASSYKLYRATSAGGTKTLLGSPTGTTANDTSAVSGTTYYYWVVACRATVCSDYSAYDTGRR